MKYQAGDIVRYKPQAATMTQNRMTGRVILTQPEFGGVFIMWENGKTKGHQRDIHGKLKPRWSFEENLEYA